MSILTDGERAKIASEMIALKNEIARNATSVINDVILRKEKFTEIKQYMLDRPDIFTASDLADLNSIAVYQLEQVQVVFDILSS